MLYQIKYNMTDTNHFYSRHFTAELVLAITQPAEK